MTVGIKIFDLGISEFFSESSYLFFSVTIFADILAGFGVDSRSDKVFNAKFFTYRLQQKLGGSRNYNVVVLLLFQIVPFDAAFVYIPKVCYILFNIAVAQKSIHSFLEICFCSAFEYIVFRNRAEQGKGKRKNLFMTLKRKKVEFGCGIAIKNRFIKVINIHTASPSVTSFSQTNVTIRTSKNNSKLEKIYRITLAQSINILYNTINICIRGSVVFGYLQVQKSELLVREFDAYKAVYCGLCKQMGKDYSFLTRLSLSYDATFYTMIMMSLEKSCTGFKDGRCRFNPLKKCKFAKSKSDCYSKAAALSVITAYYKLIDDKKDGGFFKRLLSGLIKPFFGHWHKKAKKLYPELEAAVSKMMEAQSQVELGNSAGIDASAHPTAEMLATVLSLEGTDDMQKRVLYEFGYHIGRWVYLMDAADDLEKDKKHHNFNPFLNVETDNIADYQTGVLNQSLARAYDAYNLLVFIDFKGILDNMMLYGFPSKQNAVVYRSQEEEDDKSI